MNRYLFPNDLCLKRELAIMWRPRKELKCCTTHERADWSKQIGNGTQCLETSRTSNRRDASTGDIPYTAHPTSHNSQPPTGLKISVPKISVLTTTMSVTAIRPLIVTPSQKLAAFVALRSSNTSHTGSTGISAAALDQIKTKNTRLLKRHGH